MQTECSPARWSTATAAVPCDDIPTAGDYALSPFALDPVLARCRLSRRFAHAPSGFGAYWQAPHNATGVAFQAIGRLARFRHALQARVEPATRASGAKADAASGSASWPGTGKIMAVASAQ